MFPTFLFIGRQNLSLPIVVYGQDIFAFPSHFSNSSHNHTGITISSFKNHKISHSAILAHSFHFQFTHSGHRR